MIFKQFINKYWLFLIIVTQPILDIIAYFSFNDVLTPITFTIRSFYLLFIVLYTFIKVKNKRRYLLYELPFALFSILHILNSYRTSGFDLFDDIRYLILVMQLPIITVAFCIYLKENKEQILSIQKALVCSLEIIFISVILSLCTNTYSYTYGEYGITGWFTSANTQSMILAAITPYCLYKFSKKSSITYLVGLIITFVLLFFNGTKACYYTLIVLLFVMVYIILLEHKEKKIKLLLTIFFLGFSIILYKDSFTSARKDDVNNTTSTNQEVIERFNYENLSREDVILLLNRNELYNKMINHFGEDRVYELMKDQITAYNLLDNRLAKRNGAKLIFEESDFITKLVGFNHNEINRLNLDLENDITAIFYYYGYIGFTIYILFIAYFVFLAFKLFIRNPNIIYNDEFIILSFSIALMFLGGEYSGALLRKSNANIYVALILALYYILLKNHLEIKKAKNNKLTFLLLHLGYGGIESSTINTANALCDKYEIELISFYNLEKNQVNKIDKRIKVKYLYNGGPNREEFVASIKEHKYIKTLKEGFKAVNILIKKRYLVIDAIIKSDSKYLVSTRWDFSILLSRYGSKSVIKIAQEHHYHNNDKKYLNILKHKYNNIDYLFALTQTLKDDYEKLLVNNKHTKVILVPNMLYNIPNVTSNLEEKNIITVSRLDYGKKNDDIIKAFSKIDNNDWKLYIIGDGLEFNNLTNLVDELDLKDRVILTGYKDKKEIEKYMLKSSIFLMASLTEGLPMVLLEAMSYGIPCIAYETASGVSDIIKNSENGYVIKDRDESLYIKKINKLIEDDDLRKNMGVIAKNTVNNFSKEEIKKIWLNILK